MTWTARTILTLLTTLLTTAAAGGFFTADNADASPAPAPQVEAASTLGEIAELTTAQSELVASSFDRFTQAGLAAPTDVVPSFHDSIDACNGNLGLSTIEDGIQRVRICWSHENPGVEIRLQEQALVHELAHAWADLNLDDESKDAFVEDSNADSWNLADSEWGDRGTERSADLITWAILDPAALFVDFGDMSCTEWAEAFELLTGASAPSTLADAC
jgi:hypothetical protein